MRKYIFYLFILTAMLFFVSCTGNKSGVFDDRNDYVQSEEIQFSAPEEGETIAILHTSMGDIYLKLFPEYAPMAVDNFTALASEGYYTNLPFHRVERNFLIQTGDATLTGTGGSTIWNDTPYPIEISDNLHHYTGAVGMAHAVGNSHGNASQFYIVQTDEDSIPNSTAHELANNGGMREDVADAYRNVGGAPQLDNEYTIFAHVFDGMDIVDEIAKTKTDENGTPVEAVFLTSVEITTYTEGMSIPLEE